MSENNSPRPQLLIVITCLLCCSETLLLVHGYPLCVHCDAHLDELRPLDAMKLLAHAGSAQPPSPQTLARAGWMSHDPNHRPSPR